MTSQHGAFIWYELMANDPEAAAAFYGEVVGWTSRPFDPADPGRYRIFAAGGEDIGGLMSVPENGVPGWVGYIGVADVDATVSALAEDGASRHVPPTDIPGVGRFAVVADPQGAVFCLIASAEEGESRAFSLNDAGHCRWNELATSDPEAAFSFYARHFGWTKGQAIPMGEQGVYQLLDRGDVTFGAVLPAPPEVPHPVWTFYFGVTDIDAAIARITVNGGQVAHGPHEVPGEEFIVIGRDPQGVYFALVGPRPAR
ncbi:MAG: VOC family protein [Pseudochelatococcus sp.]|jgi:predicted enzyme related to lactoylglutathione lyase|uniref:VOC family protein n=1 Tax=Pseudochelatococcus sp. TaxID=2020869 RepID=UPI003D90A777